MLLNTYELARVLKIKPDQVQAYRKGRNPVPYKKNEKGIIVYDLEEVVEWLDKTQEVWT